MPTEYPACREADSDGSNSGVEAPWIEPASRSASEPDSASLHKVRTARLPKKLKPDTRREEIFTNSGGVLRGERGQRVGKVRLGRLGDPCRRFRKVRDEACAKSIRRAPGVGESERPVVARKRGNARGAKGPWQDGTDSESNSSASMRKHLTTDQGRCPRAKLPPRNRPRLRSNDPEQAFCESRMREICKSGLRRGKEVGGHWPCASHPVASLPTLPSSV
jgi:hypothetical protein